MSKMKELSTKVDKIIVSNTEWTQSELKPEYFFRLSITETGLRLWRKEVNEYFYGGFQITYIPLMSKRGIEWINDNFN